jgi:hypothetical protein
MKLLHPDPPKPEHVQFLRTLPRDRKPCSDPMRKIDFHSVHEEPPASKGDWAVLVASMAVGAVIGVLIFVG